jgi:SAM-dependent methyltransferase
MIRNSIPISRRLLAALLIFTLTGVILAQTNAPQTTGAAAPATSAPTKKPDVIFVPTRPEVVDKLLELAEIKTNDVLYDLGCGDGRIVVAAAKKYGIKAVGVDIDPQRIKESLENVRSNKVAHLVTIKQADIFELDFQEATVVSLYLLPELNVRLMPKLAKLKPGNRIISVDFDMKGAKPKQVVHLEPSPEEDYSGSQNTLYKWVVPWELE